MARHNALPTLTPAGQEVIVGGYSIPAPNPQMEQLIKENERLKREVESYSEKAARLQKVIAQLRTNLASLSTPFLSYIPYFFLLIFFLGFCACVFCVGKLLHMKLFIIINFATLVVLFFFLLTFL